MAEAAGAESADEGAVAGLTWPRVVTRLFLSADISGSTAYKQQKAEELGWPTPFIDFYRQFPSVFFRLWQDEQSRHGDPYPLACEKPQIWKAIGDEIVMHQVLRSERAAACTVIAWTKAIREFRGRASFKEHRLGLKGAAWIATFPRPNFEVMIPRDEADVASSDSEYPMLSNRQAFDAGAGTLDFLGPNIDIGFRIAARATSRKFPISFELADILAHTSDEHDDSVQLRHDRDVFLKGVHGDAEYPLFWIDIGDSELDSAIDLLHGLPPYEKQKVKSVVEAAYADRRVYRPFLSMADKQPFKAESLVSTLQEAASLLQTEATAPTKDTTTSEVSEAPLDPEDIDALVARALRTDLPDANPADG